MKLTFRSSNFINILIILDNDVGQTAKGVS